MRSTFLFLIAGVIGCGSTPRAFEEGGTVEDAEAGSNFDVYIAPGDVGDSGDAGNQTPEVYANDSTRLFLIDPIKKTIKLIGEFSCIDPKYHGYEDTRGGMTDIAIDRDGNMYGIGDSMYLGVIQLIKIDKTNAQCTVVGDLPQNDYRGLSFVATPYLDANKEILVAQYALQFIRIDDLTNPSTAQPLPFNAGGFVTKGSDVVSIMNDGTYTLAYMPCGGMCDHHLLKIDLKTGSIVKDVGATGLGIPYDTVVLGSGYWGGKVYAFTWYGTMYEVDPMTGVTKQIMFVNPPVLDYQSHMGLMFKGAAVTTHAPTMLPPN